MKKEQTHIHQHLIEQCKANSRRAQNKVYRLYYKAMYNTALSIVANTTEAEEVMQEAFISAFKNIHKFEGTVSFGAWLKRIVINQSIDFVKKVKKEILLPDYIEMSSSEIEIEADNANKISIEKVHEALAVLPQGYRHIFSLYLLEGYDHEEISGILGISASTSRSQFARAKKQLKKIIQAMN